jgi:hypothetical protein
MKNSKILLVFISLFGISALFSSCHKPFEGVSAILSNSYIDHRVNVQVVDANPKSTTYYPANAIITITGDAVRKGLIYSADGIALNESSGNGKLVNNTITLAIKPYYKISSATPIKFTIIAEAPNYMSNTQDVVVSNVDSLQYVSLKILNPASLPVGVATAAASAVTKADGTTTKDVVVAVTGKETSNTGATSTQTQVAITITAGTVFKDANNNPIQNSNGLVINATSFSNGSSESVSSISGGLDNVSTSEGNATFVMASAVNINTFLGGVAVKSFSTPIPVVVNLPAATANPVSKQNIKEGDVIPLWSKSEGNANWIREGNCVVEKDQATGRLKTTMLISHLSTWMAAFRQELCGQPLKINYSSNDKSISTLYVAAYAKDGNGQLLSDKVVSAQNGDAIYFSLPSNIDVTVKMFAGSSDAGSLIQAISVPACASSANLVNNRVISNPSLYFDLETSCKDGKFRYTGPIDYKVSGTNVWEPFTPAVNGTLTTNLLEWNKTYDFRIIYKGTEFARSRQVLQSEFRASGGTWSFWGKTDTKQTFFNSPTSCQ